MPTPQVVLIGCTNSHTTPRIRVGKDFSGVDVDVLGEGDEIYIQLHEGSMIREEKLGVGVSPFPSTTASHFTVRKVAGSKSLPTTMRIVRNAS